MQHGCIEGASAFCEGTLELRGLLTRNVKARTRGTWALSEQKSCMLFQLGLTINCKGDS
jgi:hypothetical protein